MEQRIKLWFSNFEYYSDSEFETLSEALKYSKLKGFTTAFHLVNKPDNGETKVIASWDIIGGLRTYDMTGVPKFRLKGIM